STERLVEPLATELEADLGCPVVVGELEDLLRCYRSMPPWMVEAVRVLDADARDRQVVAVHHLGRGGDGTGIQRSGDGKGLHHRPGLVRTRDGGVVVERGIDGA